MKAIGQQRGVITKQVAPFKAGAREQIDFRHDEIGHWCCRAPACLKGMTTDRAFHHGDGDFRLAGWAGLGRCLTSTGLAVQIHILFQAAMDL